MNQNQDRMESTREHLNAIFNTTYILSLVGEAVGQHREMEPLSESAQGRERYMGKIEALLADLGRLEERFVPWAYAAGILKRQTGLERLEYASPGQLQAVIAVLTKRVATLAKKQKTASSK